MARRVLTTALGIMVASLVGGSQSLEMDWLFRRAVTIIGMRDFPYRIALAAIATAMAAIAQMIAAGVFRAVNTDIRGRLATD